jgi:hypothetical protein
MSGPPQSDEDAFALGPERAKGRYYFDLRDGDRFIKDETGVELDGIEAVRREAMRALRGVVGDALPDGGQRSVVVAARTEDGKPLLMASLTLIVQQAG